MAHRFRYTLATKILVEGGSIEDAANVLGDTPAIIEKHYAKFSQAYRERLSDALQRSWEGGAGTFAAHDKIVAESGLESVVRMVRPERFELPT